MQPQTVIPRFIRAAENGCERVAKFLIKKGADVNIQINSFKEPPLHYAIRKGHAQVVKVLLEGKANVNLKDRQGYTSLHIASQFGRTQIVEDLLKDKINIDVQDKYGKTPLYYAVKYEHIKIVKLLLEKGADPAYAHKPKAKKVGIAVGVITAIVTPLILAHTTVLSTLAIIGATIASALIIGSIAYGVTYMASKHALSSKLSEVNCDEVKKPLQV
ncbi:ANK_REP_REGION domain-containing protein [Trichonephila clavata]|uniref:ANK_REP_REGION domain-containing protein n=1 Tax=Trichonephila clavata TaxID=2740835 RepID=A0A8X6HEP8_TRICU|nr:ANK_REP_REGION domain-containing protein [Trichonephila clavata]